MVSLFWLRCLQTQAERFRFWYYMIGMDFVSLRSCAFYLSQEKEREEAAEKEKVARTSTNVG